MTAAEKAMQDITALLDGWPGNGANELDVLLRISRIVGRYDIQRIGETK